MHGSANIETAVPCGNTDGSVVPPQFRDGSSNISSHQFVDVGVRHRTREATDRLDDGCKVSITGSSSRCLHSATARMTEHDQDIDVEFGYGIVEACERRCARCVSCDSYDEQTSRRLIEDHRWGHPRIGTRQDRGLGCMFRGDFDRRTFDSTMGFDQLTPCASIRH